MTVKDQGQWRIQDFHKGVAPIKCAMGAHFQFSIHRNYHLCLKFGLNRVAPRPRRLKVYLPPEGAGSDFLLEPESFYFHRLRERPLTCEFIVLSFSISLS